MPSRIAIDLAEGRHRELDSLIERAPTLACDLPTQFGVLFFDRLQLRGHRLQRSALCDVEQFAAVVGFVFRRQELRRRLRRLLARRLLLLTRLMLHYFLIVPLLQFAEVALGCVQAALRRQRAALPGVRVLVFRRRRWFSRCRGWSGNG